ncbi:MAG: neutral/alkaline non-lysosomal ceramidase N-terminal domain-containing protein [Pirellulaceae bacterium]
MQRWIGLVAGTWLFLAPLATAADGWKAGAARVAITPQQLMWMSGYGSRDQPAEGKLTDLWAKALVLEDASGHRALLLTLDLVGIDRGTSQRVCQQVEKEYGLPRSQVAICTSHTHCGPAIGRNLAPLHYLIVDSRQQQLIDDYTRELEQKLVRVVGDALGKLAPVRLTWGSGQATYAVNRRANSEAKVVELRDAGTLQGPSDHDVPVLAAQDREGRYVAIVFGYACHATVLSFYQWCGDHPGFAQADLEQTHPGCVAMFWAGCGADQNPLPRRTVELARHYGRRLATAVDEVLLTTAMREVAPQLACTYREVALPLAQLPTRDDLMRDLQSDNKYTVARAKALLAQVDAGQPLSPTYPYPVATWRLGEEVQFVTLGGEVVVDYAVRLKSELGGKKTWVAGYAHDVMAYIPSRRVLREGGYEGGGSMVYYGLPTIWAEAVEETIVQEVKSQLGAR